MLVKIETPGSMWFYNDHAGTDTDSRVYVVLQRIILVQVENPGSMWFSYK